jgi:hypothetical protein
MELQGKAEVRVCLFVVLFHVKKKPFNRRVVGLFGVAPDMDWNQTRLSPIN